MTSFDIHTPPVLHVHVVKSTIEEIEILCGSAWWASPFDIHTHPV